jgi:L-fuconolactonase
VSAAFGPERMMLGSDWPVCTLAGSYGEILDIPRRYFAEIDSDAREKIFRVNAIKFYNLPNL